jgi:hypothetical protein
VDGEAAARVIDPNHQQKAPPRRGTNHGVVCHAAPDLISFDSTGVFKGLLDFLCSYLALGMIPGEMPAVVVVPNDRPAVHPDVEYIRSGRL